MPYKKGFLTGSLAFGMHYEQDVRNEENTPSCRTSVAKRRCGISLIKATSAEKETAHQVQGDGGYWVLEN